MRKKPRDSAVRALVTAASAEELGALVRDYLQAKYDNSSPPCLHRYRGIVREREIARRNAREKEALDAVMVAVGFNPWRPDPYNPSWSGRCPSGKHGLDYEGQECDLCAEESRAPCTESR